MRFLIVEDDFTSRRFMQSILSPYGDCDIAVNGKEAVEAFQASRKGAEYDLVCLDIMMPEMDGQEALRHIREIEKSRGIRSTEEVKVIITTALNDPKNVVEAYYKGGATSYITKPIGRQQFIQLLMNLGILA